MPSAALAHVAPTRVPLAAYGFADTLRPKDVVAAFGEGVEVLKLTKTVLLVSFSDSERSPAYAVAHDFGAVVFVNVEESRRSAIVGRIVGRMGAQPHPPHVDDFSVEVRPGSSPQAAFNHIVVGEITLPIVEILALVLAQSVAMEYYEQDVEEFLDRLEQVSTRLSEAGNLRIKGRELLRFVGLGMLTRNQVIHTLSLLDSPPTAWDNEILDRLFNSVRASFEIEDRYRALDHKLRMIQDNLELLMDLMNHRRAVRLEVTIVVLIAAELVLLLLHR